MPGEVCEKAACGGPPAASASRIDCWPVPKGTGQPGAWVRPKTVYGIGLGCVDEQVPNPFDCNQE